MANDVLLLRILLDCLTSFLGVSLSRAVATFGLPVYSSIHSRRITNAQKTGHYVRDEYPKLAEAAGNSRRVPNGIDGKLKMHSPGGKAQLTRSGSSQGPPNSNGVGLDLLGFNASATPRVISRR